MYASTYTTDDPFGIYAARASLALAMQNFGVPRFGVGRAIGSSIGGAAAMGGGGAMPGSSALEDRTGMGAAIGSSMGIGGGFGRPMPAAAAAATGQQPLEAPEANAFLGLGAISSVAGAVFGALGTLQSVRSSKHQAKQAAMEAEFRSTIAASNARLAEQDAQDQRDAGEKQLSIVRRQYALAEGEQKVAQAASGTYGATYDTARAALRASAKIDAMTIRRNTARAVSAQRMQAVNLRNEAALGGVTARNLRATAGTINPALPTFASVLAGAGQAAGSLYTYSRR